MVNLQSRLTAARLWLGAEGAVARSHSTQLLPYFRESIARLEKNGDIQRYLTAVEQVLVDPFETTAVRQALLDLGPWKKGPWEIRGIPVDAEWDCRLKWNRLKALGLNVADKHVLDIGAGNGFYMHALEAQGGHVLGVEPSVLSACQFMATRAQTDLDRAALLVLPVESLEASKLEFDVVLSMGVLYHRRSPLDHLRDVRRLAKKGATVVVESLVVPGDASTVLLPEGRYAGMPNVWFLPSRDALLAWLGRCGFEIQEVGSVIPTTSDEQRSTPWSKGPSLLGALDPSGERTIEGYPAPARLILIARAR